ncbi:hypothetical protein EJ08DRAFT_648508 [Tothia fuscella]|uniref:Uncharacterized protein n=1 Tax=Tothia fuscella TaxID=1048955 RepID=A0A9P4TZN1_9PEZI|nr:hypothetical protein EJ08DRAFT_648508 [Tothia fuscella]
MQPVNVGSMEDPSGFELRVGYFGLCAGPSRGLLCTATNGASADVIMGRLATNYAGNMTTILAAQRTILENAVVFQSKIFLSLPAVAGVCFVLAIGALTLLKKSLKATPSNNALHHRSMYKRWLSIFLWFSVALSLASAVAITQTTGSLQFLTRAFTSQRLITTGMAAQIIHWLIFAFSFLFAVGISVMFQSGEDDGSVSEISRRKGGKGYLPSSPKGASMRALPSLGSAPMPKKKKTKASSALSMV